MVEEDERGGQVEEGSEGGEEARGGTGEDTGGEEEEPEATAEAKLRVGARPRRRASCRASRNVSPSRKRIAATSVSNLYTGQPRYSTLCVPPQLPQREDGAWHSSRVCLELHKGQRVADLQYLAGWPKRQQLRHCMGWGTYGRTGRKTPPT